MTDGALTIRSSHEGDLDQVMALAGRSLGWAGDERDRAFFRWKHEENPAGRSPGWVAVDDGQIVAFRTFLRWGFHAGDTTLQMVRAVDTATDPDHQGRGLFTRLTLQAADDLTAAGVDAVFNTPNDQSRPGYLKMGWHELGRPTIGMRPASVLRLPVLRRARTAAEKWSEPCTIGEPAAEALSDSSVAALAAAAPASAGWSTARSPDYLAWRYRFEPLQYRAVEAGGGLVVFRVRRRGPAREVAIVEWLAPRPDRAALAKLVKEAGDYAVGVGLGVAHGVIPLPRQGPIVTWRPLARAAVPSLGDLSFSLGDLELF
ncbi:MAG: GNAT family N-acetyltransferase [Acidimicrobiales bacterium]